MRTFALALSLCAVGAAGCSGTSGATPGPDAGPPDGTTQLPGDAASEAATDRDVGSDSAPSADASATPNGIGTKCQSDSDCPNGGLCVALGAPSKVCTIHCPDSGGCGVPGWGCVMPTNSASRVCACTPSPEICDGLDNDCNGIVDDEPAVDMACNAQWSGTYCKNHMCDCRVNTFCSGKCVDLQTDPNNCGACNAVCSGAQSCQAGSRTCLDGAATCATVRIGGGYGASTSPVNGGPSGIAVDATNVYWKDWYNGEIMKTAVDGSSTARLAQSVAVSNYAARIVADPTGVYWTEPGSSGYGYAMRVPVAGGAAITLDSTGNAPTGIAVNQQGVYWTNAPTSGSSGLVKFEGFDAGAPATIASGLAGPEDLVVDATNLYWTSTDGTVMKMPLSGGSPVTLASSQGTMSGLAADAINLYWMKYINANSTANGAVMTMPLAGGTPTTLTAVINASGFLAVDGTNVYWTVFGAFGPSGTVPNSGLVMRVPVAGGTPATLVAAVNEPSGIAVDGTSVYWRYEDAILVGNVNSAVAKLTPK